MESMNTGSQNTAGTPETNKPIPGASEAPAHISIDPKIIPEKFKGDIGKLVSSYAELEKKLSTKATETKSETKTPSFSEIEARFWEKGELSAEDKASLKAAGFSDKFIDSNSRVYQAEVKALKENLAKNSDGLNTEDVVKFVNDNIGKKYSQQFVDLLTVAIGEGKYGAWRDVISDFKEANSGSKKPDYTPGKVGQGLGFNSAEDIRAAFKDRRANGSDPEYMKELQARVEATDPSIVEKFNKFGF